MSSELEQMLEDSAQRLFSKEVDLAKIEQMELGQWQSALWDKVEQSGLLRVFAGEADGGAEADWTEALPVLLASARALLPLPFVDGALCGWLLGRLGLAMPDGPIGLADLGAEVQAEASAGGWSINATLDVPWGRHVQHVLVRARTPEQDTVWLLLPRAGRIETGENIAGEPRDRLIFDNARASACAALPGEHWEFHAAVAKVICGQAAGRAASISHQVHGAIGFTREHSLHFATRRLWSWRAEYASEPQWAARIGARAIQAGGQALWPTLTAAV